MTDSIMTHPVMTDSIMTHSIMTHSIMTHPVMTDAIMTHPVMTHPKPRFTRSAKEVHLALKSALKSIDDGQKCAVICFGEIMERQLYRELGYSSINQYAAVELSFSTSRTRDFVMLCKRLEKLPLVKEQLESGQLGYTTARVLVPVLDETNEKGWVDLAGTTSRRKLEKAIKCAKAEAADKATGQQSLLPVATKRPAAVVPVRVSFEMTPTQFARYEAMMEQIRKHNEVPADRVEALLEITQAFSGEKGPRGPFSVATKPPVQIHIHRCVECEKASIQTSRGELEISAAELEQAECDCQISREGERNTTSIPPATRRQILAKYRHKCQRPGCSHTRYLHVHHKTPRSQGGSNAPENLTCLCSACHTLLHDKKLSANGSWVKSPAVAYEWSSGALSAKHCPPTGHIAATHSIRSSYAWYVFAMPGEHAFQQG